MAKSPIKTYISKSTGVTTYYFQIRLGDTVTKRRGFPTKRQAEVAYFNLKQEYYDGKLKSLTGKKVTFREVYKDWKVIYKNSVREQTYIHTKQYFKTNILPHFGDKYINKITVRDCQKALDDWVSKLSYYKTMANYTEQVFKLALKYNYITENPFDKIDIPRQSRYKLALKMKHEKQGNNFFTESELMKFLKYANMRHFKYYAFFRLLAFTGMRRGEILAIGWKDLDYETKYLTISKSLNVQVGGGNVVGPTKNGKSRIIIIDDKTLEVLAQWKQQLIDEGKYVEDVMFPSYDKEKNGTYYSQNAPRKWEDTILKDMKFDKDRRVTIHGFRHTHAVLLYDMNPNITPKDVQHRLGHATSKFTMDVYEHVTENSDDKITEALKNMDKM
ncbi:tyrosine-type recombinase/integrase [Companilactobacillus mishanensis]|nr:site-specific integrase [Companilactobacillus mishanensis]